MRYHYDKPEFYFSQYGKKYDCDHPLYKCCTLYQIGEFGLCVIQQRFDPEQKSTYWTEIDPYLIDQLYLNPGFQTYFKKRAGIPQEGLYPTVTVRQIMWALKMKPLKRERWETLFDHCPV